MWQQKINNFTDLDELAGLPDEVAANKTELWQKLENRLQKKSKKIKPGWYWTAACLVVFVTIVSVFTNSNKKNTEAIFTAAPTKSRAIIVEPTEQIKTKFVIKNESPQKSDNEMPTVVNTHGSNKNKIRLQKIKADSLNAIAPVEFKNISFTDRLEDIDSAAIATTIPTKKKINVVHINELLEEDRIAEQNTATAKTLKKRRTKTADKTEYAGTINFRIYFKN